MKKNYAVLDTNIIISALLKMALSGKIIPVLHKKIEEEYWEVCKRKKFNFPEDVITRIMNRLIERAIFLDRTNSTEKFP